METERKRQLKDIIIITITKHGGGMKLSDLVITTKDNIFLILKITEEDYIKSGIRLQDFILQIVDDCKVLKTLIYGKKETKIITSSQQPRTQANVFVYMENID
jgi:hypothetical protein